MGAGRDDYGELADEGVVNWLALTVEARAADDPRWRLHILAPEGRRACASYLWHRYLEFVPTDELFTRYRELLTCTFFMNDEGQIEFYEWGEWNDALVHTATELAIRDQPLDERAAVDASWTTAPSVALAVAGRARHKLEWSEWVLVKYGAREFMRPLIERGAIRISPASYYNEPSLDMARRDAELERAVFTDTWTSHGLLRAVGTDLSPDTVAEAGLITPIHAAVDYYVYCLAGGFHARLFDDFSADSCIVITDPRRFLEALRAAVSEQLPGWHYGNNAVRYVDPFEAVRRRRRADVDPVEYAPWFCKHFRYHYQREIRIAWLPPEPRLDRDLDHVFVEVGPLDDYCELVEL